MGFRHCWLDGGLSYRLLPVCKANESPEVAKKFFESFFSVYEFANFGRVPCFDVHIMMPYLSDLREHSMRNHRGILNKAFNAACHKFLDDDGQRFYDYKTAER